MTQIRIKLTADHFRTLVSGGEVIFDDHDMAHSHGIDFDLPSGDDIKVIQKDNCIDYEVGLRDRITIILEDMGWPDMAAIIEEVWQGDAPTQRKPYHVQDFDECECGDYRQDHDLETGRCRMPDNMAHGMQPCLAFKLLRTAKEIPEPFRSR